MHSIWKEPKWLIGGVAVLLFIVFLFVPFPLKNHQETEIEALLLTEKEEELMDNSASEASEQKETVVIVDVKGEVKNPGVYELTEGDRVKDAIEMAGGINAQGEENGVNLAERLYDEMVIYVPKEGEEVEFAGGGDKEGEKVDLNRADQTELETLPGIGPAKAKAIIRYREEHGLFQSPEEIKQVSGIGEKSFEQLQDLVTVR